MKTTLLLALALCAPFLALEARPALGAGRASARHPIPYSLLPGSTPQRAIVADVTNASRDRHTMTNRAATDALAMELTKAGAYEVVSRSELERAAKDHHLQPPFGPDDVAAIAKDVGAEVLVTGEIHHVDFRVRDRQKEYEVGLIVHAKDIGLGETVNGAAARGFAYDALDGHKPEALLIMEAAQSAAARAAEQMASFRPIVATILNTAGFGRILMNKGAGDGIRPRQEFVALRYGARVARLRVVYVHPQDSELAIVENTGGIQPQDIAVALFPEPKFGPR